MLFTFGCCRFRETVENVRKTTTTLKKKQPLIKQRNIHYIKKQNKKTTE